MCKDCNKPRKGKQYLMGESNCLLCDWAGCKTRAAYFYGPFGKVCAKHMDLGVPQRDANEWKRRQTQKNRPEKVRKKLGSSIQEKGKSDGQKSIFDK